MKTFVVVNPASGGGRTGKQWPRIARALRDAIGSFDAKLTRAPQEASALVREAAAGGATNVIAVGGDGTINEAINGLCNGDAGAPADVVFGAVTSGTGGDFRRSFGINSGVAASIERLKNGTIQTIDLGAVTLTRHDGTEMKRWSNNIASFGFSGEVVRAVNEARFSKLLGGRIAFLWNSFRELQRYDGCRVVLDIDGHPVEDEFCIVAVCNGRYFGGGMMIAPDAKPDDGTFDVVFVRQNPRLSIFDMRLLYSGAHLSHPNVSVIRAKRIEARSLSNRPVLFDVEGEGLGRLPATFQIVPAALRIRC
jgi:YegS/Rv2252/BmrU family lipid kinase